MQLTQLQTRVVNEIVSITRRDDMKQGDHLNESFLAERIGTSRSPVNVALRHLVARGVVVHDPNRGYFLRNDANEIPSIARELVEKPDEPLYLAIAEDRLTKQLDDEISETELMKRYSVSRNQLRNILSRIQQEGWIEKLVGQGWRFLPMIDSVEAYEESYLFRSILEPAGLMALSFCADTAEFEQIKKRQEFIATSGFQTMTATELFEANTEFHETLATWSGNRFLAQTVRRMDHLRRLVEYWQAHDREPRKQQALEHLRILDAISQQDTLRAAALLREHLNNARKSKTHLNHLFAQKSAS